LAPTRESTNEPTQEPAPAQKAQLESKRSLSDALGNTRRSFWGRIKAAVGTEPVLSTSETDALEEILYTSDLGPRTVERLMTAVKAKTSEQGSRGLESVRAALREEMLQILNSAQTSAGGALNLLGRKPSVLLVIGVNGAGKTTTIGKLAARLAQLGQRVLVAAGDTFRAAAGEQLKIWTERAQVEVFYPLQVTDPSAVAFAACERAQKEGFDIVIVDTAGRLHTQKNLMEELKKMQRVIKKLLGDDAPHEVLLVLDANSGQNALVQAREFGQALQVTGVVLTKLDGTAKGGVAVGLAAEAGLPIKLIGVGEGLDDLRDFSATEFVDSILEEPAIR
jgi:fused signal recognition particle receptor